MSSSRIPSVPPSAGHPLDLQISYRLGAPLVYVSGELDHQTAPRLRVVIDEEQAARPRAIILDLSKVTYIDSGGLSLIFDVSGPDEGVRVAGRGGGDRTGDPPHGDDGAHRPARIPHVT